MKRLLWLLGFVALLVGPSSAEARPDLEPRALPPAAAEADIDEQLGRSIDRDLTFTDSTGRPARLGDYFDDGKPVIVVLAYYRCPMLCGLVLRGAVSGLALLPWRLGEQYHAITVSIDPREQPEAAAKKRAATLDGLGYDAGPREWPFLVGDERSSRALADALGFRYGYDAVTDQYAHPAAIFVLTPSGAVSRYLYGTDFAARDLRLALLEASRGAIGTIVDRTLMTCYRYDPALRRYGPYVFGFLRLGGLAILLTVGGVLALLWQRDRRRSREAPRC